MSRSIIAYYNTNPSHPIDPSWIYKFGMKAAPIKFTKELVILQELYPDYEWVILDPNAEPKITDLAHPPDKTIYLIGDDKNGVIWAPENATFVSLNLPARSDGEWFASMVVPIICYDRFLYLEGLRK